MTDLRDSIQRDFITKYLWETLEIVKSLDINSILEVLNKLKRVKLESTK